MRKDNCLLILIFLFAEIKYSVLLYLLKFFFQNNSNRTCNLDIEKGLNRILLDNFRFVRTWLESTDGFLNRPIYGRPDCGTSVSPARRETNCRWKDSLLFSRGIWLVWLVLVYPTERTNSATTKNHWVFHREKKWVTGWMNDKKQGRGFTSFFGSKFIKFIGSSTNFDIVVLSK